MFVSSSNVPWNLNVLFLICQNAFHASVVTCCPCSRVASMRSDGPQIGISLKFSPRFQIQMQEIQKYILKQKNNYGWHLYILMVIKLASLSSSLQYFKFKYKEYKITNTSKTQIQLWVASIQSVGAFFL